MTFAVAGAVVTATGAAVAAGAPTKLLAASETEAMDVESVVVRDMVLPFSCGGIYGI